MNVIFLKSPAKRKKICNQGLTPLYSYSSLQKNIVLYFVKMYRVELIRQEFKTLQQLDGFTIKPDFADINSYYKQRAGHHLHLLNICG